MGPGFIIIMPHWAPVRHLFYARDAQSKGGVRCHLDHKGGLEGDGAAKALRVALGVPAHCRTENHPWQLGSEDVVLSVLMSLLV